MVRLRVPHSAYPKNEQIVALAHQLMDRVRGFSGVQSVAVTHQMPVDSTGGGSTSFLIVGRGTHSEGNEANGREVSPGYFQTLQARLVRGRYFHESEDASKPRVMIINRAFARRYFPGEDPIGKEIRFDASEPVIEIVGMVNDIKEGPLDKEVHPAIYTPFDQGAEGNFYVVVRTGQEPQAVLQRLVATIHQIGPAVMTSHAETMTDRIDQSESAYLHRSSAWLVGGFAAMAGLGMPHGATRGFAADCSGDWRGRRWLTCDGDALAAAAVWRAAVGWDDAVRCSYAAGRCGNAGELPAGASCGLCKSG
jgi:hypothetical protein